MNHTVDIIIGLYAFLLRLYPSSFRKEFEEQMLLDFSDMVVDARTKGRRSFVLFCLRELVDFPFNLLRTCFQEGDMLKILRLQPINYGMRGAVGFAVTFFLADLFNKFIYWKIDSASDAIMGYLFDLFHTERGPQLVSLISFAASVLCTGLLFGIMLAFLFADRSRYSRYIVVSMLSWFLHYAVTGVLVETFNMGFYLGSKHASYLMNMMTVLSILFVGLLFVVAKSDKKGPYRCLIVGTFAYPLLLYFYIQLLFKIGLIEAPGMFIALTVLVVIYIGSVLIIAIKSEDTPKIPWIFFVFSVGYFLVLNVTSLIYWQLFPTQAILYTEPQSWQETFLTAMRAGFFEIPLGIFVGIALALQKKNNQPRIVA